MAVPSPQETKPRQAKSAFSIPRDAPPVNPPIPAEYSAKLWGTSAEAFASPGMGEFSVRCGYFTRFLVARHGLGHCLNGRVLAPTLLRYTLFGDDPQVV
jgi:hypothetical protein